MKIALTSFIILCFQVTLAQIEKNAILSFDFNSQRIEESNNKVVIKPVGVSLSKDRFGNENSACYLHGSAHSYLNQGTNSILKPKIGSISIWVNLERIVYIGRGYRSNPIIATKNGFGEDFNIAYCIIYDAYSKRWLVTCTKDSTNEATIKSNEKLVIDKWYHLVISFDNNFLSFYVNGELQQKVPKNFETNFLISDSVMIGNSASKKNERYAQGTIDDIYIFNKVLTPKEVEELYNAPNPNKNSILYKYIVIAISIIIILVLIIFLIIIRNNRVVKRQKEFYELNNRIAELEIKVIKNQINPHFISNSLASIQELIYSEQYQKAGLYIAKFSLFLRQVLSLSDNTFVTLNQELDIIKLYVELEQLRFKKNFHFNIKVDLKESIDDIHIPTLITQPFIENAIWHGLLPKSEDVDKVLSINIYEKEEVIFIEIEDNGVGRTLKENKKRTSMGTQLVLDKIASINKLIQANNYSLEIIDLINQGKKIGTKVVLTLRGSKDL